MNKKLLIALSMMVFSFNALACGGDVSMSVPHIHNEQELLVSINNASGGELKEIDIYQIFAGELALEPKHHEAAEHKPHDTQEHSTDGTDVTNEHSDGHKIKHMSEHKKDNIIAYLI